MYKAKHTHVRTVSDERVLSGCVFATARFVRGWFLYLVRKKL